MIEKLIAANTLICLLIGALATTRGYPDARLDNGLTALLYAAAASLMAWVVVAMLAILLS